MNLDEADIDTYFQSNIHGKFKTQIHVISFVIEGIYSCEYCTA
jgi:hypothetical protein